MLLYPIKEFFIKTLGLDYDKFRKNHIDKHNKTILNKLRNLKKPIDNILIILPHCIQNSDCPHRVTWDKMDNCKKCGKCMILDFLEIKHNFGIEVVVVTGGTAARKVIKEAKPELIIAIACENDLISGLRDTDKLPVLAIINERPNGPCVNTFVDMNMVKKYIAMVRNCNEKTC